jgi:hypothetical protein
MTHAPETRHIPALLVWPAVAAASAAILMGAWQLAFFALGLVSGGYVGELEGMVRLAAAAGAVAMAVTLPAARLLLRFARASMAFAIVAIPLGAWAAYLLLPRVFPYANF